MSSKVTKAILPVAGLGTRLLPATKSIPKEIMALVDRPLIQYAIDEGRAAGIEQFILVTSRGKGALEDYFDKTPQLEGELVRKGKTKLIDDLRTTSTVSGEIVYVRQHEQLGLGHAVWCARKMIADEPFAVMLTDDVILSEEPCLSQMIDVHRSVGGNVIALMEVEPEDFRSYGLVCTNGEPGKVVSVTGMVEKPGPEAAPSNLAIVGRYILMPEVLSNLAQITEGADGEIQLTDAIAAEARKHDRVHGYLFDGTRYDCGSKSGFLRATAAIALNRSDLRDDFLKFIRTLTD